MSTSETTRAGSLIESLSALTVLGLRQAFPAHARLMDCQLVYDGRGVGHVRTLLTSGGPRTLCGRYGDILPGDYTSLHGAEAVHRATCEGCYEEGRIIRDAIEDEREPLRVATAHVHAISSVLGVLRKAVA